ncbi:MAG: hypothetical protein KC657_17785 [Myxococcales bacterium]|nr:hypothetical protein [Myxococcales bacterium]
MAKRQAKARTDFPPVIPVGRKLGAHEDIYHWVLTLRWTSFFALATAAFLLLNLLFAGLYALQPGCVSNARSFADLFYFSVQTIGTIGYGTMTPVTHWANALVTAEALAGLLVTALVTGITFARFARPTARILFSEQALITPRNGVPTLMFRMANWRRNQIIEAQLNVMLLRTERTKEGEVMRRPEMLKLVRDRNPFFALTWTAMHTIDESSPFYGEGAMAKLREEGAELFATVTGMDETISAQVHARFRYSLDDIVEGRKFADVLTIREDGARIIDYDKFHVTLPVEPT